MTLGFKGLLLIWLARVVQECASDAVWIVPVARFDLLWKEWRNPACLVGSVWRPDLSPVDVGDGAQRQVIMLGDVFIQGQDAPNFLAHVLVHDPKLAACPARSLYPCFDASPPSSSPLFAAADYPAFDSVIWTNKAAQCVCSDSNHKVGAACPISKAKFNTAASDTAYGVKYEGPALTGYETGFVHSQSQFQLVKPMCPTSYYVLGHVGRKVGTIVPENYKCIHERIMRKAGDPATYTTGSNAWVSLYQPNMPWYQDRSVNPTILPEYDQQVMVLYPDCHFVGCGGFSDASLCVNDTISQGLFYAFNPSDPDATGTATNQRITASQERSNLARAAGPRCLSAYRECKPDQCDLELGATAAGTAVPGGLLYVIPNGAPAECGPADGCAGSSQVLSLVMYVSMALYRQLVALGLQIYSSPTFPLVSFNSDQPDDYISIIKITLAADGISPAQFAINIPYSRFKDQNLRPGPAIIRIRTFSGAQILVEAPDVVGAVADIGVSIGRMHFYRSPTAATLYPAIAYNGPECQTDVQVVMEPKVNLMDYGGIECMYSDDPRPLLASGGVTRFAKATRVDLFLGSYPRALLCTIPPRTGANVTLMVSLNKQQYHIVQMPFYRMTVPLGADEPGQGALRIFSVVPRSGPSAGGTQMTILGKYFSYYKTNKLKCRFIFKSPLGTVSRIVPAMYIDDGRLECFSVAAVSLANEAQVDISVDGSAFCAAGTGAKLGDRTATWNSLSFYYTYTRNDQVPSIASMPSMVEWYMCANYDGFSNDTGFDYPVPKPVPPTKVVDCRNLPATPNVISQLGWFGCLRVGNRSGTSSADTANPTWCMRALPVHAGNYYSFHIYDPFGSIAAFMIREVPLLYPGTCSRSRSAGDVPILITFQVELSLIPRGGLTLVQQWQLGTAVGQAPFEAALGAALPSVTLVRTYLRVAVAGSGQVTVDVELSSTLRYAESLMADLSGSKFRQLVMIGTAKRGRYADSQLILGGNKVLSMSAPVYIESIPLFSKWKTQLDYTRPLITMPSPDNTTNATTTTPGRDLIETLMSHPAVAYQDGRSLSYMKDALHKIGEQYGFLDLSTSAFTISWDAVMTAEYSDKVYRASGQCDQDTLVSGFKFYSGMLDGEGYVNWLDDQTKWTEGRPICNNPGCAAAPFSEPASTVVEANSFDRAMGCARLRINFNCTDFDLGKCMKGQVDPGRNAMASNQYANVGSKAPYSNDQGWCDFYYPETWGPNNINQDPLLQSSYRYRYRLSPCIQCRQARDICKALAEGGPDPIGSGADRLNDANLNYAAEIDLGCFAQEHTGGIVMDQCCPDACSATCSNIPTATDLETCLRPEINPMCADPRHGTKHLHTLCNSNCVNGVCSAGLDTGPTTPLCSPRSTFFEPI